MKASKFLVVILGAMLALAAAGSIAAGAALSWAYGTQRNADGFLTSPSYPVESAGYAVTTSEVDLGARPGDWWPTGAADVQFSVETDGNVFLGIGPATEVDQYLGEVSRDVVTDLGADGTEVITEFRDGSAPAAAPAEQTFWVAAAQGDGIQELTWEVTPGTWQMVVMNSDAAPGVAFDLEAGARIPVLLGIGLGLLAGGLLLGAAAAAMLVWATLPETTGQTMVRPVGSYPVTVTGNLDPDVSRWMWLVKWFLAIPHFVALAFLWVAYGLLTVVAFFAILFTGRYPRSIFDFNVGVLRWSWRVSFYGFSALGTDQYPPFTLADVEYPARLDVEYPAQLSRGLALVKWWLLAIPHYLIVGLFTSGLIWWTTEIGNDRVLEIGGGLIGLLVMIAALALAFTGRYPRGLFDLVVGLNRWVYRVAAYASLMRDEYPPFRLDLGGEEPFLRGDNAPSDSSPGEVAPIERVDVSH